MAASKTRAKFSGKARASSSSPKLEIFGRLSPPPPVRTYGRRARSSPRRHQHSQVSSSAIPSTSNATAQAYEPLLIRPETPSDLVLESDVDEPVIFLRASSPFDQSVNLHTTSDKAELQPDIEDLQRKLKEAVKDAEDARKSLQALRQAQEDQATCSMCQELMLLPYIIHCGHTFCKGCLLKLVNVWLPQKRNMRCPICRKAQGHFTPIRNFGLQDVVDGVIQAQGLPAPDRSDASMEEWPVEFRSKEQSFPFEKDKPGEGTYPVSYSIDIPQPAPFPVSVTDEDDIL